MATAETIFREAALIQLTATCWQVDKQLPPALLAEVGNTDYLRGRKLLLSPDCTLPVKQVVGKARHYLRKIALPFPITGCQLVPKKLIPEIQEELQYLELEYNEAVNQFLYWYPEAIEAARENLADLFNDCDYPDADQLKNRFRFHWRYITIGPTGSHILPPSIYREEVSKFRNLLEQARQEAINSLREEFVNLISNLNDKLSGSADGKPKRLRDAAIENLRDFLDSFASRNLFQDDELSALVEQCKSVISGTSAREIRASSQIRDDLRNGMNNIWQAIDGAFEDLPRRKLRYVA